MRNYFTFAGVDSRDFGVYISGQGTFSAPEKAYEFYAIPGRNGALIGNEKRLENIEVTYEAFIYSNFNENIAKFRSFLLSVDGYQRLQDTYHTDEFRMACYKGAFEPTVTSKNDAGSFQITFVCKPQRYLTAGELEYSISDGHVNGNPITGVIDPTILTIYSKLDTSRIEAATQLQGAPYFGINTPQMTLKQNGVTIYSASYTIDSETQYGSGSIDLLTGSGTFSQIILNTATRPTKWQAPNPYAIFVWRYPLDLSDYPGATEVKCCNLYSKYTGVNSIPDEPGTWLYDGNYIYVMSDYWLLNDFTDFLDNNPLFFVLEGSFSATFTSFTPTFPASEITLQIDNTEGTGVTQFSVGAHLINALVNPCPFPSKPIMRVYGNGVFTMGGITITVTNASTYTDIDCEVMDCYEGDTNRNKDVTFSTYDFPEIPAEERVEINIVSGITEVDIKPRWWRV